MAAYDSPLLNGLLFGLGNFLQAFGEARIKKRELEMKEEELDLKKWRMEREGLNAEADDSLARERNALRQQEIDFKNRNLDFQTLKMYMDPYIKADAKLQVKQGDLDFFKKRSDILEARQTRINQNRAETQVDVAREKAKITDRGRQAEYERKRGFENLKLENKKDFQTVKDLQSKAVVGTPGFESPTSLEAEMDKLADQGVDPSRLEFSSPEVRTRYIQRLLDKQSRKPPTNPAGGSVTPYQHPTDAGLQYLERLVSGNKK